MTESALCPYQDSEDEMQIPRDVHIHMFAREAWLFKAKLTKSARRTGCCKSGREGRKKIVPYLRQLCASQYCLLVAWLFSSCFLLPV